MIIKITNTTPIIIKFNFRFLHHILLFTCVAVLENDFAVSFIVTKNQQQKKTFKKKPYIQPKNAQISSKLPVLSSKTSKLSILRFKFRILFSMIPFTSSTCCITSCVLLFGAGGSVFSSPFPPFPPFPLTNTN